MDVELKGTDSENLVVWLRGIHHNGLVDTIRGYVQMVDAPYQCY